MYSQIMAQLLVNWNKIICILKKELIWKMYFSIVFVDDKDFECSHTYDKAVLNFPTFMAILYSLNSNIMFLRSINYNSNLW
jgi:hypothetical protein